MSNTSSDDEENQKLLLSVDRQFMSNELYSNSTVENEHAADTKELPPSLRFNEDHSDTTSTSGLKVTSEFQTFVAKRLSQMLDSQLKEVDPKKISRTIKDHKHRKKRRVKDRVRLLHASSTYLELKDAEDIAAAHNAKRKSRIAEEVDSGEENVRLAETVVSSEWILSGAATKGWEKSTRGEVIPGEYKDSGVTNGNIKKKKKKKKKAIVEILKE